MAAQLYVDHVTIFRRFLLYQEMLQKGFFKTLLF